MHHLQLFNRVLLKGGLNVGKKNRETKIELHYYREVQFLIYNLERDHTVLQG